MLLNDERKYKARRLSAAGLVSALCVVILYLGSLLTVLDITCAAVASLGIVFAVSELRGAFPILMYLVISGLSLVLLPIKTPAIYFILFAGYYPIIKLYLEQINRTLEYIFKVGVFWASLTLALIFFRALMFDTELPVHLYIPLYLGGAAFLIIYDIALSRLITFYYSHLRKRLKIAGKFRKEF
jgi:hypothetical protein